MTRKKRKGKRQVQSHKIQQYHAAILTKMICCKIKLNNSCELKERYLGDKKRVCSSILSFKRGFISTLLPL